MASVPALGRLRAAEGAYVLALANVAPSPLKSEAESPLIGAHPRYRGHSGTRARIGAPNWSLSLKDTYLQEVCAANPAIN